MRNGITRYSCRILLFLNSAPFTMGRIGYFVLFNFYIGQYVVYKLTTPKIT